MSDPVLTETRGRVLLVTLNRPERRNAVDRALAEGIAAAMERLDGDDALAVGVLQGAGRGFCAGMDLAAFAAGERPFVEGRGFAGLVQRPPAKPLIAAVEGFAVAGGLEVALACDVLVAARDARLGIPEVKRGLVAAGGALVRLPRRIGRGAALELALTGTLVDAERAHALGLVNRLAEPGEATATALALAEEMAANAPLALRASKAIVDAVEGLPEAEAWSAQAPLAGPVFASEDAREGALAFTERREPRWSGR
jgi:enoyl-CoA hydratase